MAGEPIGSEGPEMSAAAEIGGGPAGRARWLALGALALAMLTIGLDTTVLVVALPTMAIDLHANTAALQWFTTAYTLALAAMMLPAGALGDRYGRKKFLLAALVVFGGASLWCTLATSAGMLIAARAVLGVAAAAMMPLSMAVLPGLFPDRTERQRALTIWVSSTALGLPLGPIVGGWLLEHFWWGSVFLINIPLVVVGTIAVAILVPESRSENAFRIDLPGVVLSALGMLGFTYGFIRLGDKGWGDGTAWAAVVAGAALLGIFVWWQRRTTHPLVDVGLFGEPWIPLGHCIFRIRQLRDVRHVLHRAAVFPSGSGRRFAGEWFASAAVDRRNRRRYPGCRQTVAETRESDRAHRWISDPGRRPGHGCDDRNGQWLRLHRDLDHAPRLRDGPGDARGYGDGDGAARCRTSRLGFGAAAGAAPSRRHHRRRRAGYRSGHAISLRTRLLQP